MKYLITIMILVMSFTVKAQDVVRLPVRVAKQVQADLLAKDTCESMLNIATEEIMLLGKNVQYKQMVIDTLTNQGIALRQQVENEKNMKLTYKGIAEDCKTSFDSLKTKSETYRKFTKLVGFVGTAVIAGLTAVILFVK